MREYDDDNIQHYAPVLRRILILVAVIIAVPVVLWTITAFMRTYIAQPTIPDARPLLPVATTAPTGTDAATGPTTTVASTAAAQSAPATADSANADTGGTGSIPTNTAGQPTTTSSPWPASPVASAAPTAPAPAAAPSAFPNPGATSAQAQPDAAAPDTAAADDTLPPPDPITGPVPMPRHRPSIVALADGPIPLPRARPADAPEPPKSENDTPPTYDPGIGGVSGAH